MAQITLDIPESMHMKNISDAVHYFVQFSQKYPTDMEDMILGMRMRETDNEETISLSNFLS